MNRSEQAMLDTVADYVERQCQRFDMPCQITGGVLRQSSNSIELDADFTADPLACQDNLHMLSSTLKNIFNCEKAGGTADGHIWIYNIRDMRRLEVTQ